MGPPKGSCRQGVLDGILKHGTIFNFLVVLWWDAWWFSPLVFKI